MTFLLDLKSELLEILRSNERVIKKSKINKIISKNKSEEDVRQLIQLFYALKLGNIQFVRDSDNKIKMIDNEITGYVEIYSDSDGYLDKFFLIPKTDEITNIEIFESAIKKLNANYEIVFIHNNEKQLKAAKDLNELAVASMVKIIVAGCVYDEIDGGAIDFETQIEIKRKNISVLSSGLSDKDVGKFISIKDLLRNMLLLSDNSAMDIFIDFLGKNKINKYIKNNTPDKYHENLINNIKLTKTVYGEAWCFDKEYPEKWRSRALTEVAWFKGLDYFIPLSIIGEIMKDILKQEWVPWDDLKTNEELVYKGGSAPGVLSCVWSSRKCSDNNLQFLFAFNRESIFSLLEELYIFECANKLLHNYLNANTTYDEKGV